MSGIDGWYYEPGRSGRVEARLHAAGGSVSLRVGGRQRLGPTPLERVRISDRLGNTPRFLTFADGGQFETGDNAGVDALLRSGFWGLVHSLESHWRWVALSLMGVALFVYGGVRYGIPALAEEAAFALPASVNTELDRGALGLLDERLFKPSTLEQASRERLRARFEGFAAAIAPRQPVNVLFRDGGETIGPNALALPSGSIVFTDQLVVLAQNDEQLLAIFAHELGHLVRRHGMRQAIQGSVLTLLAVAILGDVSSVSSMATGLPLLLTELGYSREFEREADDYAIAGLQRQGVAVRHFAEILVRLDRAPRCDPQAACEPEQAGDLTGYLSTHPATAERLARITASH